jgi:triosephosphate isomerase
MPIVAGNWKMHKTRREAAALLAELRDALDRLPASTRLRVYPPFTALATAAEAAGGRIEVGAQNLHPEPAGAYTGEISARMILEAGATHVLVGHSERRSHFAESDDLIARKLRAALASGMHVLYCVGEQLADREGGRAEEVLAGHIEAGMRDIAVDELARLEIAYEPVWAIGTGRVAELSQVIETHAFLRKLLSARWDGGERIPILYGGSVEPENAGPLLRAPEVAGVLVGGASLDARRFLAIAGASNG